MDIKKICVFCGSSSGDDLVYSKAAVELGCALAENNIGLVYGGANIGIMGQIASTVVEKGGQVIGVMPRSLVEKEVSNKELKDLRVVSSMHERKAVMAELSDGFIALPGGLGTIEEFVEAVTWLQLGIHKKPCGLLNINQFFDRFISFLDYTVETQFMQSEHRDMIFLEEDPLLLIEAFKVFRAPEVDKAAWVLKMNKRI